MRREAGAPPWTREIAAEGEPERLPLGCPARGLRGVRSMRILVLALSLWSPVLPAQAEEAPAADAPIGPAAQPLPQPAPGGKGPGMGRGYQLNTPGPGRGYPGYRSGPGFAGPAGDPAYESIAPSGLGPGRGPGGGAVPPPRLPLFTGDFPVYGTSPGIGPGQGRQRYRGGPGYPGLRGPGTSYKGHRQYGRPPLYPIRQPQGQDWAE